MVNIAIIAFGTRGDVQPLLALGRGLRQAGHEVCVVAGANFQSWIERSYLPDSNRAPGHPPHSNPCNLARKARS